MERRNKLWKLANSKKSITERRNKCCKLAFSTRLVILLDRVAGEGCYLVMETRIPILEKFCENAI